MSRRKADKSVYEQFGKRLASRVENRKEFAQAIGVSYETVRVWTNGETVPDVQQLISISNYLRVSIDWLLTGKEEKPKEQATLKIQASPKLKAFHREFAMDNYIPVRLLRDAVAAGSPAAVNEADVEGWCLIYADKRWIPGDPENYTCCRVKGSSMFPILSDGDIVAINHSEKDPRKLDKKMVAFRKNEGVTIKWLKVLEGGLVVGVPENKDDFDSVISLQGEEIETGIVGKVAWWWAKRG
jgi:phage repressor protein C with HTH and peptisase S24 domain